MGDEIIIASEHEAPTKRVGVRKFHRGERDIETLSRFRALRHVNIVAAVEAFIGQEILYVAFEEMHMPLENIVRCPRRPTSNEVGVILGQVRRTLNFVCAATRLLTVIGSGRPRISRTPSTLPQLSKLRDCPCSCSRRRQNWSVDAAA